MNGPQATLLDALSRTAIRIFRPLVRILLRHNVSYKTCAEWLRWCYADVAWREFALPGRKQSKSRVAVLTGLTRVDVQHLLDQPAPDQIPQQEQYHRAALVLSGWAHDADFQRDGGPIPEVPFESTNGEPSFTLLVQRHSGGATPRAVLDELVRSGAVDLTDDRRVRLLRTRYVAPATDGDMETAKIVGLSAGTLLDTIDHNWRPDQQDKRLQLVVYNTEIPEDLVPAAREQLENAARELSDRLDRMLSEFEHQASSSGQSPDTPRQTVGLGLYYWQQP